MPRDIGGLYEAASAGVGAYRAVRGQRERHGPQHGAGGGLAAESVKVTGFNAPQTRLLCKRLDASGAVTGAEFEVLVRAVGATVGSMDIYVVANNTVPSLNVGQCILIAHATIFTGAAWVTGLWTWDQYAVKGC